MALIGQWYLWVRHQERRRKGRNLHSRLEEGGCCHQGQRCQQGRCHSFLEGCWFHWPRLWQVEWYVSEREHLMQLPHWPLIQFLWFFVFRSKSIHERKVEDPWSNDACYQAWYRFQAIGSCKGQIVKMPIYSHSYRSNCTQKVKW